MRFTFIGKYDGKWYELQGNGIRDITGEFISYHYETDYEAIGAARKILKWVLVPDGSLFSHYFESVEIHVDNRRIAEVCGERLYRYALWP